MLTSVLYLLDRGELSTVLMPDADGVPNTAGILPLMFCCDYLNADFSEVQLISARNGLGPQSRLLFVTASCPDGPPYRSGIIFTFQQQVNGSWLDGSVSRHGAGFRKFSATTTRANWSWINDAQYGRPGYFVMGQSGDSALWRVFRVETDALGRAVVTLSPVQLTARCPKADFHDVADKLTKSEVLQQYEDLGRRVIAGAYRDVPTKVRNIVEALVANKLKDQGHAAQMDLGKDLQLVKTLLEDRTKRATCGWDDLEYHLLQKLRLVHAQTHPGAVVDAGKLLSPEFALSVVDDLLELLRIWKYVNV